MESEHTTRADRGTRAWDIHSRIDCPTSEMDGAQKSTVPGASPSQSSARRRDMSVLPVPQAMMALHRSWPAKACSMAAMASAWCGRGSKVTRSAGGLPSMKGVQSMPEAAILAVSTKVAPEPRSCCSRFLPGPAALVMTMYPSMPGLSVALAKNESHTCLGRSLPGS